MLYFCFSNFISVVGIYFQAKLDLPDKKGCSNDSICLWLNEKLGDKAWFKLEGYARKFLILWVFNTWPLVQSKSDQLYNTFLVTALPCVSYFKDLGQIYWIIHYSPHGDQTLWLPRIKQIGPRKTQNSKPLPFLDRALIDCLI